MYVKERPNHYQCTEAHHHRNTGGTRFPKMKTQIGLLLPSAACLLLITLAGIVSPCFVTNCSVGNEPTNILPSLLAI